MKPALALCAALFATPMSVKLLHAAPHLNVNSSVALDQQLAATLDALSSGKMPEARVLARQAARSFPDSALAQLLWAELAASAAHQSVMAASTEPFSKALKALLDEAQVRLQQNNTGKGLQSAAQQAQAQQLPDEVIQLGKEVSALLVVDLQDSTLHHLAISDGVPTLIRQHYVGSGKAGFGKQLEGDNRTPLGVYTINGQRSDESLPDLYGAGALTLNYPNALDLKLGRTGSGIWLHGVPHAQRSRAPRSSEGCVTMSNDHFNTLRFRLSNEQSPERRLAHSQPREPLVLLTHSTQWQDASEKVQEQKQFQQLFSQYQQALSQEDQLTLISLYATPAQAMTSLNRIENERTTIAPLLSTISEQDISIFRNPTLTDTDRPHVVMHMQFGLANEYQLTLYWERQNDDQWRIVTEQWNALNS